MEEIKPDPHLSMEELQETLIYEELERQLYKYTKS
jgi:hypothetical protein